jgi:hypothetical protein
VNGPGDPNGFSTTIALFPSSVKICYTLTAFRIAPATAAASTKDLRVWPETS